MKWLFLKYVIFSSPYSDDYLRLEANQAKDGAVGGSGGRATSRSAFVVLVNIRRDFGGEI